MTKTEMVKGTIGLVASVGVIEIVGNTILAVMPPNAKIITKVCVWVGGAVIASMASDSVNTYIEETIDGVVEDWKKFQLEIATAINSK